MGRVFGLLVLVTALWAGAEVYTQGTRNAFGGALAPLLGEDGEASPEDAASVADRAGAAALEAHRLADERREKLLGAD